MKQIDVSMDGTSTDARGSEGETSGAEDANTESEVTESEGGGGLVGMKVEIGECGRGRCGKSAWEAASCDRAGKEKEGVRDSKSEGALRLMWCLREKKRPLSIRDMIEGGKARVGDHRLGDVEAHLVEVRSPGAQGKGSKSLREEDEQAKKVCNALYVINQKGRKRGRVVPWGSERRVG